MQPKLEAVIEQIECGLMVCLLLHTMVPITKQKDSQAHHIGMLIGSFGQAKTAIGASRLVKLLKALVSYSCTQCCLAVAQPLPALLRSAVQETMCSSPKIGCSPPINELAPHEQVINWNSHRIEEAVSICMAESRMVAETHAAIKSHLARVKAILASWVSKLIVERKPGQVIHGPSHHISGEAQATESIHVNESRCKVLRACFGDASCADEPFHGAITIVTPACDLKPFGTASRTFPKPSVPGDLRCSYPEGSQRV